MPPVYWILVVNPDKLAGIVEKFMPETDRLFFSINQLQVSSSTTKFSSDIEAMKATAVRLCPPRAEFAFVSRASRHRLRRSRSVDSVIPGKCTKKHL